MDTRIRRWLFILLVPLIPVVLLYLLFDKQNYFQLQDVASGIFIVGPIGIYLVLVKFGSQIFLNLPEAPGISRKVLETLCGDWAFESISTNGHVRTGNCKIECVQDQLTLTGTFKDAGKTVGTWKSELAGVRENNFLLVYSLHQIGGGGGTVYGLVQIPLIAVAHSRLEGTWNVVGEAGQEGSIIYTRKSLAA